LHDTKGNLKDADLLYTLGRIENQSKVNKLTDEKRKGQSFDTVNALGQLRLLPSTF
jgi:hypothetical protein